MLPSYEIADKFRTEIGQPMGVQVSQIGDNWDVTLQCETAPMSLGLWASKVDVEHGTLDEDSPPQFVRSLTYREERVPGGSDSWEVVLTDRPMIEPFALKLVRIEYEDSDQDRPAHTLLRRLGPVGQKRRNRIRDYYQTHGFEEVTVESRECEYDTPQSLLVITKAPTRRLADKEIHAPEGYEVVFSERVEDYFQIALKRE